MQYTVSLDRISTDFFTSSRKLIITDFSTNMRFGSWLKQFSSFVERLLKLRFIHAHYNSDVFVFCCALQFCHPASKDDSEISRIQVP